jgi:GT2 family glycosyltransferase
MPQPDLTAAVLTYNGRELLEVVLPSLAAQRYGAFETIVVDNGSTDDTVRWLNDSWHEVGVVSLPQNIGVTAALNVCLDAGTGKLVALLNNDVELDPDCLAELVGALDAHPEAAVATAKLIDFYDRQVIDGAGDVYAWTGEANRRGHNERDVGQYERAQSIFGACGGVAVYRRAALETVGLFDEDFFAFQEDVDWSFRAQLRGHSCRYVPTAIAYHMGSATLGREPSEFMLYQNRRNALFVVLKNYPLMALLRHGHRVVHSQAHDLVWAIQTGRVRIFLRVWRDALRGLPAVLRKRREVQRSRTVGLKELERVIGADG